MTTAPVAPAPATPTAVASARTVVAVTGGRDYTPTNREMKLFFAFWEFVEATTLVHGDCRGVDHHVERWLETQLWLDSDRALFAPSKLQVVRYPVDPALDGPWPAAGPRRTERMLRASGAHYLAAFPGGKGTAAAIRIATRFGIPVRHIDQRRA